MKTQPLPSSLPLGRLSELATRSDADLLAVKTPTAMFGDYQIKRYASRKALETFLRNPGTWRAVVSAPVPRGCCIHPAFQREEGR